MKTLIKSIIAVFAVMAVLYLSCKKDNGGNKEEAVAPTVTTDTLYDVCANSAKIGGTVVNNGGENITRYGICCDTIPNPEITPKQSAYNSVFTGRFTKIINNLKDSAVYYARAYAENNKGVGYGKQTIFTTRKNATDNEGKKITEVMIGSQVWMAKNLDVTRYNNGDSIPNVTNDSLWNVMNTYPKGAYCNYNNDEANATIYGRLYNWYAVTDKRGVCPTGFHVPSDAEWTTLVNAIGGEEAGGKLKEAGTAHWQSPNTGADNSTGFTALPGGIRTHDGLFSDIYLAGLWQTSSRAPDAIGCYTNWIYCIINSEAQMYRSEYCQNSALSIRCIKDK
jgi:uncharacterized protein (TIGR02145 family)